jgi:hypothetical protein
MAGYIVNSMSSIKEQEALTLRKQDKTLLIGLFDLVIHCFSIKLTVLSNAIQCIPRPWKDVQRTSPIQFFPVPETQGHTYVGNDNYVRISASDSFFGFTALA